MRLRWALDLGYFSPITGCLTACRTARRVNAGRWAPVFLGGAIRGVDRVSFTVKFDEKMGLIRVACSGDLDLSVVQTIAAEVSKVSARTGCSLILNDLRDAMLTEHAFDVYRIPRVMEEVGLAPTVRRALVVGDRQEEFHFLETVFVNFGNEVQLFADIAEAEVWLLG